MKANYALERTFAARKSLNAALCTRGGVFVNYESMLEEFERRIEWDICWISSAMMLERAANILWGVAQAEMFQESVSSCGETDVEPKVASVCMMLSAFVVENYAKCILVSRNGALSESGSFKYSHHNLVGLLGDCAFEFCEDERWLLIRLKYFAVASGRYPAPQRAGDMWAERGVKNESYPLDTIYSNDYSLWRGLVERLKQVAIP